MAAYEQYMHEKRALLHTFTRTVDVVEGTREDRTSGMSRLPTMLLLDIIRMADDARAFLFALQMYSKVWRCTKKMMWPHTSNFEPADVMRKLETTPLLWPLFVATYAHEEDEIYEAVCKDVRKVHARIDERLNLADEEPRKIWTRLLSPVLEILKATDALKIQRQTTNRTMRITAPRDLLQAPIGITPGFVFTIRQWLLLAVEAQTFMCALIFGLQCRPYCSDTLIFEALSTFDARRSHPGINIEHSDFMTPEGRRIHVQYVSLDAVRKIVHEYALKTPHRRDLTDVFIVLC